MQPAEDELILDVGAGHGLFLESKYELRHRIIAVDLQEEPLRTLQAKYPEVNCIVADAMSLPFLDHGFAVVFSNAVIEHVGGHEHQRAYAREIARVGRSYFVTTPNKYFPFDFHYGLPFYQFLPERFQRWLFHHLGIGLWYAKDTYERIHLVLQPHFVSFRSQGRAMRLQSVLFRSSNHHQSIGDGRFGDRFGIGAAVVLVSAKQLQRLFPLAAVEGQRVTFMSETLICFATDEC